VDNSTGRRHCLVRTLWITSGKFSTIFPHFHSVEKLSTTLLKLSTGYPPVVHLLSTGCPPVIHRLSSGFLSSPVLSAKMAIIALCHQPLALFDFLHELIYRLCKSRIILHGFVDLIAGMHNRCMILSAKIPSYVYQRQVCKTTTEIHSHVSWQSQNL